MAKTIGRIIGLDVGNVRIGVAVTDPLRIISQPKEVIKCSTPKADAEAVRKIVEETEAVKIVVGMPLDLEGKQGPQAEIVNGFIEELKKTVDLEIVTIDERYTTAEAERMLISANISRKNRKKVIDKIAAQYILQMYIDRQG